jgi:hypothetical protein
VEWDDAGSSSVTNTDGVYLIVFVKDGRVVRAFDHEVADGNLACIERSVVKDGLTPSAAVLRATPARAANGSGYDVVSIARPRNASEARLTSRCLENYS